MSNVVPIHPDEVRTVADDQGARIDAFGQVILLGIFSDLCQLRCAEPDQNRVTALDGVAKRLGKLLERYEP